MTDANFVIDKFFGGEMPEESVLSNFMKRNWMPLLGPQIRAKSEKLTEALVDLSSRCNSEITIESLQVLINDFGGRGKKLVRENGVMCKDTLAQLEVCLRTIPDFEDLVIQEI